MVHTVVCLLVYQTPNQNTLLLWSAWFSWSQADLSLPILEVEYTQTATWMKPLSCATGFDRPQKRWFNLPVPVVVPLDTAGDTFTCVVDAVAGATFFSEGSVRKYSVTTVRGVARVCMSNFLLQFLIQNQPHSQCGWCCYDADLASPRKSSKPLKYLPNHAEWWELNVIWRPVVVVSV